MFYDIFTILALMKVITMIFYDFIITHKIALLNGSIINWTDD